MICALTANRLEEMAPLLERQQLVAITGAVAVLLIVLELVRRRKLREEYSWVWVATAIGIVILALNQGLLKTIGSWIGAVSSVSTLFFGAIIFLIALTVQFSVRLSRLTHRQRTLAQRLALLEEELTEVRKQKAQAKRTSHSNTKPSSDEVA